MKIRNLIIALVVILLVLIAGGLYQAVIKPRQKPVNVPPGGAAMKLPKPLPTVILLYQKGEGESDLAVFVADELSTKNNDLANFKSVNTLDEPQMTEFYGVNSVPALIFLTPSGKIFNKHEGYLNKNAIIKIIGSIKEKR